MINVKMFTLWRSIVVTLTLEKQVSNKAGLDNRLYHDWRGAMLIIIGSLQHVDITKSVS